MRQVILIFVCFNFITACNQKQRDVVVVPQRQTLPCYTTADFTPEWFENENSIPANIHTISSFSFTDQNGHVVNDKTIAGKIYVADFFFTSCPGICPKLTKNLKLVQDSFLNDPAVILLSHSVTPDKDDVSALKKYANNFGVLNNKWFLLTGNHDSIYTIARKSYFADEDLGLQKNPGDFLHTENMLLIDTKRRIRGIYKGTSPLEIQNMIADIKILEKENH